MMGSAHFSSSACVVVSSTDTKIQHPMVLVSIEQSGLLLVQNGTILEQNQAGGTWKSNCAMSLLSFSS